MQLSVVIITYNEECNMPRTLASVEPLVSDGKGEIIVVDSGSTDRTVEIAKSCGAKVFVESWKGYAAQKNSAIDKATGDWILSLDADEALEPSLLGTIRLLVSKPQGLTATELEQLFKTRSGDSLDTVEAHEKSLSLGETPNQSPGVDPRGYRIPRKNYFLGRWIRHGGFWPDSKLRLFCRGYGSFEERKVHEDLKLNGYSIQLSSGALLHHSYPTLSDYIDHMNRYSSLGAEMIVVKGKPGFSVFNIAFRPMATFVYNYFFRLGFLDGREGLLLHFYHAVYVSWKYAKAWELGRKSTQ